MVFDHQSEYPSRWKAIESIAAELAIVCGIPGPDRQLRHGVWQPAANEIGRPAWATPYVLRHTAASLLAQRGVPVSAVAAALGHDPAMFLRTYAHLYPGGLGSGRRCDDVIRSEVTTELLWSAGDRESSLSAGKTRGQIVRPEGLEHKCLLTCNFESGCRDLNPDLLTPSQAR